MAASRSKKPLVGARARARRPDVTSKRKLGGAVITDSGRPNPARTAKQPDAADSKSPGPSGAHADRGSAGRATVAESVQVSPPTVTSRVSPVVSPLSPDRRTP